MKKQSKKSEVQKAVVVKSKVNASDHITDMCVNIGNSLSTTYHSTLDIKAAQAAIGAYGKAITAAKAQLIYKKMTGSPSRIVFFETE